MWKFLRLTLLAAAVESGSALKTDTALRCRDNAIDLVDSAYRLLPARPPSTLPIAARGAAPRSLTRRFIAV